MVFAINYYLMKHILLSISDSDKHFASAVQEYTKRMWKGLVILDIKPVKYGERWDIIKKETNLLISKLQKLKKKHHESVVFLLTKWWKQWSTSWLHKFLKAGKTYIYIIWGPYGMDEDKLKAYIDQTISFGMQTMPHGLAKLVLLEQVYRIGMIEQGRQYHY